MKRALMRWWRYLRGDEPTPQSDEAYWLDMKEQRDKEDLRKLLNGVRDDLAMIDRRRQPRSEAR